MNEENKNLERIWERIDSNFSNMVSLISDLVNEVKKMRENHKLSL
jgi:hypothetical protein